MAHLTTADLRLLVADHPPPCVSVYTAAATAAEPAEGTALGRRHKLKRAAGSLAAVASPTTAAATLEALADLLAAPAGDKGSAVFVGPDFTRTFDLHAAPADLLVVGSAFHVRPLLAEPPHGRYYLLTLSQNRAQLFKGDCHGLQPVPAPAMPDGFEDALRTHDSDEPLTLHSFRRGGRAEAIFHGHGVGIDDHKDDLVRYFRAVDAAVHPLLAIEHAPLVLAGVEALFPLYAEANKYPHLRHEGVHGNPDRRPMAELHRAAWPIVAAQFAEAVRKAVHQFHNLHGTGRTVVEVRELARAAMAGELERLLLLPTAESWGRVDGDRIAPCPAETPGAEELYNLAAVHVLRHRGSVHLVDAEDLGGLPAVGIHWLPKAKHHPH